MARTPKEVTDAELAVLEALWDRGPSTIRALVEELYPGGAGSEYATVQKLCERLAGKGCVARDRRYRPHRFRASVDRGDLIRRQLRSVVDRLCEGSYVPLISHLVRGGALTAEEIRELRQQVERLDRSRRAQREDR